MKKIYITSNSEKKSQETLSDVFLKLEKYKSIYFEKRKKIIEKT